MLTIFQRLSRLSVNFHKSELLLTTDPDNKLQQLVEFISCKLLHFLIRYLGLSLSNKRLSTNVYQPLLKNIQSRLLGWKANKFSIGGRHTVIDSVISSILIYYMSSFLIYKGVIKKIDLIHHYFLWHRHKETCESAKPIHLANWGLITRSKTLCRNRY
jgi:hypothetical protein